LLRFSANLSVLFGEAGFLDRFAAAAAAGFRAVEFHGPYDHPAGEIRERLERHALELVVFNTPNGGRAGDRGLACLPGREGEFADTVGLALRYAKDLGCRLVHCLSGQMPAGVPAGRLRETFLRNLRAAASEASEAGVTLLLEPLNPSDFPGYFLSRTEEAAALIAEIGMPNVAIEYDVYQAQRAEGNLAGTLRRHFPLIRHIQIADVPSRQEPGTGEIRFEFLLAEIERLGYAGWVGCDYRPSAPGLAHLNWMRAGR
jgi:hydroxypyruvate isomerase